MARPERHNVDYYPREVNHGRKMHVIESRFGNEGYAVWSKLLEELGKTDNHYLDINDDTTWMYIDTKLGLGSSKVMEILKCLVALKVIHLGLWSQKIIFIQKFTDGVEDAYKRRNNKCWHIHDICKHLSIRCEQEPCWCGVCVDENPQSKVEESKEKKSKEDIHPIQVFILENCPRICKIPLQLTYSQGEDLRKEFGYTLIRRKIFSLENHKNLNYHSVYESLKDWCTNDFQTAKENEEKQLYKHPAKPKTLEKHLRKEIGWAKFAENNPKMAAKFIEMGKRKTEYA